MIMGNTDFGKAMNILSEQYDKEDGTLLMSSEQEEKYAEMIEKVSAGNGCKTNSKKMKGTLSVLQRVAIFLVCMTVLGSVTMVSADAIRLKIQKFFSWEKEQNTILLPYDTTGMDGWENYFALTELPEGYVQTYAKASGAYKTIVYEKNDTTLILEQQPSGTVISVDNESTVCESVTVIGSEGKYYNNEKDSISTLYLSTGDYLLTVYARGEDRLMGKELIKFLNGSLTFIKET